MTAQHGVDLPEESELDVRPTTLGGRRVVEKTGSARARSRLRREAAALEQLSSRGVVELIEIRESETATTLVTAYVGARTLADAARLHAGEILRALRETCLIVIGIHERGWMHGRISAEHVILGPRARVRLCSFGDAVPLGTCSTDSYISTEAEPSGTTGGGTDLDDLIALFRWVSDLPISGDSLRERREWRRMRSLLTQAVNPERQWPDGVGGADDPTVSTVEKIQRLARWLEADSKRPRRVRWSLGHRTRSAPQNADGRAAAVSRKSDQRTRAVSTTSAHPRRMRGLAFAIGVVAAGVVLLTGLTPRESGPEVAAHESDVQGQADESPTTSRSGRSSEDGASLPHGSPGNFIVFDGRIYRVGLEGDRVIVGDWNCDGAESALLLRPSSGEIYHFREWASEGRLSAAELVSVVEGATELYGHSGDCGAATVRTDKGSNLPVVLQAK